jgi:methylation protein MtfA
MTAVQMSARGLDALGAQIGPSATAFLADRPNVVERDLYDPLGSSLYDAMAVRDSREIRDILRVVRPVPGSVLELAAGSGRLTFPLLGLGREVTALDLSPSMLEILAKRVGEAPPSVRQRVELVVADMSTADLGCRFGVAVLGTTSVSLLSDLARGALFGAVRRQLTPGGRFVLTTVHLNGALLDSGTPPADLNLRIDAWGYAANMFEHIEPDLRHRGVTVVMDPDEADITRVFTTRIGLIPPDELIALADAHGFELVEVTALEPVNERLDTTLIVVGVPT